MAKNIKYETFGAGRAGNGRIDMRTGNMEFVHGDTSSGGSLPISISHVYSSVTAGQDVSVYAAIDPDTKADECKLSKTYGKGFRLNLHQTLERAGGDGGGTEYVLTDAAGEKHAFKERYYYLDSENKKEYRKPAGEYGFGEELRSSDISIGYDGKLTYEHGPENEKKTHEVFAEIRTDSGLVLKPGSGGFINSHRSETRLAEMVQLENDIKNIERTIEDLKISLYGHAESDAGGSEEEQTENKTPYELSAKQRELQTESFRIERMDQYLFSGDGNDRPEGIGATGEDCGGADCDKYHAGIKGLQDESLFSGPGPYGPEQKNWCNQKKLRALRWDLQKEQEICRSWQNAYSIKEEERSMDRTKEGLKTAGEMLEYKRYMLEQYEKYTPADLVTDPDGMTYGFSGSGKLVTIYDVRRNVISLMYEDDLISKVICTEEKEISFEYVNGKLDSIVDTLDMRTKFVYDGNDRLTKIVYHDGDASSFGYTEAGLLYQMISPSGMGLRLEYDRNGRPVKAASAASAAIIDADGMTEGEDIQTKDSVEIIYSNGMSASVLDVGTGYRTTYLFDPEGEWVTEYTELGSVMKNIRTYDVSEQRCRFTMQQTAFDEDLTDLANMSYGQNVSGQNGDAVMGAYAGMTPPDCTAEWVVTKEDIPEHVSDLVLSGFAIADSMETPYRRKTAYCDRFGHDHSANTQGPRFELRAKAVYKDETGTVTNEREFIAGFDWKTKTKQFTAIPITFNEHSNGDPIRPSEIRITADYSNNINGCRFSKPSLSKGDWIYAEFDDDRKIFECGSRKVSAGISGGETAEDGVCVTYAESFFRYDGKGNLTEEETDTYRNGIKKTYLTRYEYDKRSRLIRTAAHDGMISEISYDKEGNAARSSVYHISDPATRFVQDAGKKEEGHEFVLGINPRTGDVASITASTGGEPNGTEFGYTKGFLTRLSSGGTDYDYTYDGWGRNTEIRIAHADTPHVRFSYRTVAAGGADGNGSENGIGAGNDIVTAEYANGEKYETTTDRFGKLLKIDRIDADGIRKPFVSRRYDGKDRLISVADHHAGKASAYEYNDDGSLKHENTTDVRIIRDRNEEGRTAKVRYTVKDAGRGTDRGAEDTICEHVYENEYDGGGNLLRIELPKGSYETAEYDAFGRVTAIRHPTHRERITYRQDGANATNFIKSVYHGSNGTRYAYDRKSNIREIRENGRLAVRYRYDDLNRLIREDNALLGKSETIEYGTNGNIRSRNTYGFTLKNLDSPCACVCAPAHGTDADGQARHASIYGYAENGNRDRLTEYNGEMFEYDVLGNPSVYRNKHLEWSHLRDLVRYRGVSSAVSSENAEDGSGVTGRDGASCGTDGDNDVTFGYDAKGIRRSKETTDKNGNRVKTKYYWAGSRLLAERRTTAYDNDILGSTPTGCENACGGPSGGTCADGCAHPYVSASVTDIEYIQGMDGLTGFTVSKKGGTDVRTYYYRKNLQNDITHIHDAEGNVKARYVYDAWGNHKVIDENGKEHNDPYDTEFIGNVNPFRYRGYYYDTETRLYYLMSRYYDPETGRFVNADDIGVFDKSRGRINGLNLYSYSSNNPVMFFDPTGRFGMGILNGWNTIVGLKDMAVDLGNSAVNTVTDLGGAVADTGKKAIDTAAGIGQKAADAIVDASAKAAAVVSVPVAKAVSAVDGFIDGASEWIQDNSEEILTAAVVVAAVAITVATAGTGGIVAGMMIGAVVGAGSGAATNIISQSYANGFDNIDWGSVGMSALTGAAVGGVTGGIGGGLGKAAIAGKTMLSSGTKVASNAGSTGSYLTRNYTGMANAMKNSGMRGNHSVYMSTGDDYVGITGRNLSFRAKEHKYLKNLEIDKLNTIDGLNIYAAKIIEQSVMRDLGFIKNGGVLLNLYNSISSKAPLYRLFEYIYKSYRYL